MTSKPRPPVKRMTTYPALKALFIAVGLVITTLGTALLADQDRRVQAAEMKFKAVEPTADSEGFTFEGLEPIPSVAAARPLVMATPAPPSAQASGGQPAAGGGGGGGNPSAPSSGPSFVMPTVVAFGDLPPLPAPSSGGGGGGGGNRGGGGGNGGGGGGGGGASS